MQNLARDDAGNIWEIDAAGTPVRMVEPAAPAVGRVFTLAPNPKDVRQEQRQERREARADANFAQAQENAAVANELKKVDLDLKRQQIERDGNTAKTIAEWRTNLNNIGLLEKTLADLRQQYDAHLRGKGPLKSLGESYAPSAIAPEYAVFDTTAQSMLADMAKAKGLTAQQFNTPAEQRMFFEPLIPKRGDPDEVIEKKLENLERMIRTGRATTEQHLNQIGQKADTEVPDPTTGADLKPQPEDNSPPEMPAANAGKIELPTGGSRIVRDPRVAAQVDALINAGAGEVTINAALKKAGFPTINRADLMRARKWMKENPGQRYYGSDPTRVEPLSFGQRILANENVAPIAAGLGHYFNTATAGIPAALAGPEGQGALDAAARLNPTSSAVGGLAGAVTGAAGAEAALVSRAPAALARFAPRMADALYGGVFGFNTAQEGEGLEGAAKGAIGGAVGGALGERAMRGLGVATRGVRDPAVQYLRGLNIPLTVGQAVGNSGRIGGAVKKVEDALTSLPLVGNMVEARRMEGLRGFNQAAFGAAAPPGTAVTETGARGMGQLRQAVSDAYNAALNNATVDVAGDALLPQDISSAQLRAYGIPQVGEDAADALTFRIGEGMDAQGMMSGRDFQEAYRGLGRDARAAAGGSYASEFAGVMREGQDALGEALERQNPGAFEGFLEANAANRRVNVIADALKNAGNQAEELITPAQLNRADINSTSRLQGKINSASGNRPFYDLAEAGQQVLPSKLPDSGTWTRTIVGGSATGLLGGGGYATGGAEGAGTGAATGLGATLLLAAGGSRPAQRALTAALADRPDPLIRLGDRLVRQSQIGGWTGAGVLTPLLVGQ